MSPHDDNIGRLMEARRKIDASAKEAIEMLKTFTDTSTLSEIKQNKYKGEISGEIEYPGELI